MTTKGKGELGTTCSRIYYIVTKVYKWYVFDVYVSRWEDAIKWRYLRLLYIRANYTMQNCLKHKLAVVRWYSTYFATFRVSTKSGTCSYYIVANSTTVKPLITDSPSSGQPPNNGQMPCPRLILQYIIIVHLQPPRKGHLSTPDYGHQPCPGCTKANTYRPLKYIRPDKPHLPICTMNNVIVLVPRPHPLLYC